MEDYTLIDDKMKKSVGIILLTYFFYGLTTYLKDGAFIVPSPLNHLIYVGFTIYTFFSYRDREKLLLLFLFFHGFFSVLSNNYYWNFILDISELHLLQENSILPWIYLVGFLSWIFFSLLLIKKTANWTLRILVVVSFVFSLLSYVFTSSIFQCIGFGFVLAFFVIEHKNASNNSINTSYSGFYSVLLLFIFTSIEVITELVYG